MTGYIYVITNDINGKQYVGKTTDILEERFKDHCKPYMLTHWQGRPLYAAMNKYGVEHFSIQQIGEYPEEELGKWEQFWINELDTYKNGYNATLGGEGTQKYDYNIFIQDFNNGLNIQQIAEKNSCSPDTVSKALHKANLDTTRGLHNQRKNNRQPVLQYSMDDSFIQEFESYWAAAEWIIQNQYTKIPNQGTIRNNIAGAAKQQNYRKSAYGFKWKIKENTES